MNILNKPIEMVAVTDKTGKIKPIRFRTSDTDDSEQQVIKIERVLRIEEIKVGNDKARQFFCEVIINERNQPCEVVYILSTMKWILYKI